MSLSVVFALFGLAISVGFGAIGSALGVGSVASIGAGLLSKEPQKFPQVLALAALPSTQALYGLLFGFIILTRIGLLGGTAQTFDDATGLAILASSIPVGVACLISGAAQGKAAASGMKILAEKPQNLSQAIVLAALIESFAVFGLVISLLLIFVGIKI
ncbi:MAG: V-type ATP synthase subunit K [Patescibacteria group bacterium]